MIIKKASQKVYILARIAPYMCISKRKLLINAFFKAQFSDYPLVWMCNSRSMNIKSNRLHGRCLRIIYNGKSSSFVDLLAKDGSVPVHTRNLQILATEMFEVHENMSTELMLGLFCVREAHYNLRNPHYFAISSINFVYYGLEGMSNLGLRLWNLVPDRLKELKCIAPSKITL